ncbi:epidermal growth factor receptor substrate 15-like 1 isoform X2 [Carassius gibelio]|uniref:epidermal growth factor receptor substrate 15-like 1 isoform X2 n=1 Tax=Carassius gibelio TaxID=101364 RepID=UPI0022784B36|nr:epidermal growth factor receptor substrate 15-like 1 isoform X2 [Carassius gibelio]
MSSRLTLALRVHETESCARARGSGNMAALTPLSQLSSGNPAYESFYRQVDPGNTGKVGTLCQIWDLSDIDKDGHLDKEEFSVAMHLVYAAREKESVPSTLPSALIPPSKHKKIAGALPGSVPILPSTPFLLNENLRPTPVLSKSPLGSSTNLSPSRQPQTHTQVTGGHTAYGKLTKEQFCLAMHLIQEKVKGVDPPRSLSPQMIPPSERKAVSTRDSRSIVGLVELTGIKDQDDINQEISQLQRFLVHSEKRILETEIRQKEEALRQRNSEVQAGPFSRRVSQTSSPKPKESDPFAASDPFGSDSFGGKSGFDDFSQMSKK